MPLRLRRAISEPGLVHVGNAADKNRSGSVCQSCPHSRPGGEQGNSDLQSENDGSSGVGIVLGTQIFRNALYRLRRSGPFSRCHRIVWRDGVFRSSTHPGNRGAHGAGGPGRGCLATCYRSRGSSDCAWSRYRGRLRLFPNETFAGKSGRRFRARSSELRRRLRSLTDYRFAGVLFARPHRHSARSSGSAALRVELTMQTLWNDLRYGARILLKRPLLSAIAIIALALSIGANTAIFSAINTLLLRPLPVKDIGRLVFSIALREGFDPVGSPFL